MRAGRRRLSGAGALTGLLPRTLAPERTLAAEARAQAGAGESTFVSAVLNTRLKILSRITEPTSGRAETCGGRVSSLLAVVDAAFQKKHWSW